MDTKGSKAFEVVVVTRNAEGKPTGTKSFESDSAYKVAEFYERTTGLKRKRKNVAKSNEKTADATELPEITPGRTVVEKGKAA